MKVILKLYILLL